MKKCFKCEKLKSYSEFHKHPQKTDGLHPSCKLCRKLKSKEQYIKHKDAIKERTNQYYHNNKDQIVKKQNERNKKRLKTDRFFLLSRRLRNRLYYALKNKNWKKNTKFSNYIGCNREELINHIQTQFKDGMSWDNYGQWHIDHIIPLDSAKNEEELYKLCHYTNLQPLWAKDNLSKGNKIKGVNKKDYVVKKITNKETHNLILNNHYAKRLPPIQYAFGLYKNNKLVGVCTFAKPTGRFVASYISSNPEKVLELNRLVLVNNLKNEASILVSKALNLLPKDSIIISFADTKQKHIGYVYQACNFKYYGTTQHKREFQSDLNIHSSTLAKNPNKYNAVLGNRSLKHRYIYTKDYSKVLLCEKKYPKLNYS